MFEHHNNYTRIALILLVLSCLTGILKMQSFIIDMSVTLPISHWAIILASMTMYLLNIYVTYRVYKKHISALRWAIGLFALQIAGFETNSLDLNLQVGAQISLAWTIATTTVSINLLSIIFILIAYKALGRMTGAEAFAPSKAELGGVA